MPDEQHLNSVERFRKRPGQLVLEQFSHCEVPAGCGGVVLRWLCPDAGRVVRCYLYTAGEATAYVDGATPATLGFLELAPGPHLLALHLRDAPPNRGLFLFAAVSEDGSPQRVLPAGLEEDPVRVVSLADDTWKFTREAPADDAWTRADFADDAWSDLAQWPAPEVAWNERGGYNFRKCVALGAGCLGVPRLGAVPEPAPSWWRRLLNLRPSSPTGSPSPVWIRKPFTIPRPVPRNPG